VINGRVFISNLSLYINKMIGNTHNHGPYLSSSIYDVEMQQVIELSKQTAAYEQYGGYLTATQLNTFEPFKPEERLRQEGVPVGLRNEGNTCYFNSLLQSYFMIPSFYKMVMEYRTHSSHLKDLESSPNQKKRACVRMLDSLKELFAFLVKSNRKYIVPSEVLGRIVDESGNRIEFGQQADIGEFNMRFISSLEAALKTQDPEEGDMRPPSASIVESMVAGVDEKETKITSMFYGKQKQVLNVQDVNGSINKIENTQDFGVIMLNITAHQDSLYAAWSRSIKSTIEGFKAPSGNLTTCDQETWIETLPELLMFQLSRYTYNSQNQTSMKLNNYFEFPEVLYADMFLYENIQLIKQITEQETALLERVKVLDCVLKTYDSFVDTGLPVSKMIDATLEFLTQQVSSKCYPKTVTFGEGVSFCPVNKILDPIDSRSETEIQNTCSLLYNIKTAVIKERQKIVDQIERAKKEMQDLMESANLKQHPYYLHSILIHEGSLETGHYYSFIYDIDRDIWRKYSDTYVFEVPKEQVFRESFGGQGCASAYCLMYAKQNIIKISQGAIFHRSFMLSDLREPRDMYNILIPEDLVKKIEKDNKELVEEINDWRANDFIRRVQEKYIERLHYVNQWFLDTREVNAQRKNEEERHELKNFSIYLRIRGDETLCRWHILDCCVRECDKDGRGLDMLDKNEVIYKKLKHISSANPKEMPPSLELKESERKKLETEQHGYMTLVYEAWYAYFIMNKINDKKISQAIAAIFDMMYKHHKESYYVRFVKNIIRIIILRISSEISYFITYEEFDKTYFWFNILNLMLCQYEEKSSLLHAEVLFTISTKLNNLAQNRPSFAASSHLDNLKNLYNKLESLDSPEPQVIQCPSVTSTQELKNILADLSRANPYIWSNGNIIAKLFISEGEKMKGDNMRPWVIWECNLSSNSQRLDEQSRLYVEERTIGDIS
jgi:ubiquitin carboxyl-terminal hydrolase 25/28